MPPALFVEKTLTRARRAMKEGDAGAAEALYREVLARFPGNPHAQAGLRAAAPDGAAEAARAAQALQDKGHAGAAERLWTEAVRLAPGARSAGLGLALCRLDLGRAAAALAAAEAVLARHPGDPAALDVKGRCLRDLGDGDGAEACHGAALGHGDADAGPLNHLGILAQARGDPAAAEGYYRRALDLAPGRAGVHYNLSRALTYTVNEPHLAQIAARLAAADPADTAQAPLHFAMFKALDDLGETDAAFAHLAAGNALKKAETGYGLRRDALRMALARSLCAGIGTASGPAAFRPVFVTGLPRSGTTLVERILAQTPGAQACGELSVVTNAVARLMRQAQQQGDTVVAPGDLADLRADILHGLAAYSNGAPVLIDKMPLNFRWIGLICAALPEARIVHVARDPVALAWSLYRHLFAGRGNGYAYSTASIAAYMRLHREVMAGWRAAYGDQITDADYGALTRDPEPAARALVAGCGLEWSGACLAPHLAAAPVLTASNTQVRRPIYAGSDAAWRRYEAHLGPLMAALDAAGVCSPDG